MEIGVSAPKLPRGSAILLGVSDQQSHRWERSLSARQLTGVVPIRLSPGEYEIDIAAPHRIRFRQSVIVGAGVVKLSAVLRPLPILSAAVLDKKTGEPVGGAVIRSDAGSESIADGSGRFELEADPGHWPSMITVSAAGFADRSVSVPPARVSGLLDEIRLARGGSILMELQQGVPGTVVAAELQEVFNNGRTAGAAIKTMPVANETAAASVRFEGIEPGQYVVLLKGVDEWERLGELVHVHQGEQVKLSIPIAPFSLHLRTEMNGAPLRGSKVRIKQRDVHWTARVAMNESGEATVRLWQGGRLTTTVEARGLVPYVERHTIAEGEDNELVLAVPERAITGKVIDSGTGDPIAGAKLALKTISDDGYSLVVKGESGADGSFRFTAAAYGAHTLKAVAAGYAISDVSYEFREPEEVRNIEMRLQKGTTVELTVVDARGAPIGGARVLDFRGLARGGMAVTDASGSAPVLIPAGEVRDVFVIPRDGSLGMLRMEAGVAKTTLRVNDGVCRIVLRTESESHAPLSDITVMIRYEGRLLPLEVVHALSAIQGARVASDEEGRIVLDHMPAGTYEFWPAGTPAELMALAAGVSGEAPVRLAAAPGENVAVLTFADAGKP